ncbi:MAG: coniferyl aldehyde dehydrogenase [Wenzhouxiangellaceae bacterium]
MDSPTSLQLHERLRAQRNAWRPTGPDYAERRDQLRALKQAVEQRQQDLIDAVAADFGQRAAVETLLGDIFIVQEDIKHILRHLRLWMRPRPAAVDWKFLPGRAWVQHQPVGVVGIISPWNYPINLALAPLAAALAAGNRAMLKPSELTPRTAQVMSEMLAALFPPEQVSVVTGDAQTAARFAALPFDHLFFTGSSEVGRKVMTAAAANLTPVTLELGGKSPAIIEDGYSLRDAADSVVAGKWFNAGQTCVAPDYVLLAGGSCDAFVNELRAAVTRAYPDLAGNSDYTSIVSERHYQRLQQLLTEASRSGARVIALSDAPDDPARRMMTPRVVVDAPADCQLMREEIFGPVLPVQRSDDLASAIRYVNQRSRPLALYYFGRQHQRQVLDQTISGGVCLNDTLLHLAQTDLPFGGIGESGMGQYHGYDGFLTFSKKKAVFRQSRWNSAALFRPPYRGWKERLLAFLAR